MINTTAYKGRGDFFISKYFPFKILGRCRLPTSSTRQISDRSQRRVGALTGNPEMKLSVSFHCRRRRRFDSRWMWFGCKLFSATLHIAHHLTRESLIGAIGFVAEAR